MKIFYKFILVFSRNQSVETVKHDIINVLITFIYRTSFINALFHQILKISEKK